jgi:hypothetical protein
MRLQWIARPPTINISQSTSNGHHVFPAASPSPTDHRIPNHSDGPLCSPVDSDTCPRTRNPMHFQWQVPFTTVLQFITMDHHAVQCTPMCSQGPNAFPVAFPSPTDHRIPIHANGPPCSPEKPSPRFLMQDHALVGVCWLCLLVGSVYAGPSAAWYGHRRRSSPCLSEVSCWQTTRQH